MTTRSTNRPLRYDEQESEDHYDERSEADDDVEKGKIKFPMKKLYGRDKELDHLHSFYERMVSAAETLPTTTDRPPNHDDDDNNNNNNNDLGEGGMCMGGQVIFLPGYSGTGKSALVRQFIQQLESGQNMLPPDNSTRSSSSSPSPSSSRRRRCSPRFISGKYDELFSSEPYSAIADGITKFFTAVLNNSKNDELGRKDLKELRIKLEEALGGYGGMLMEFIPNLALVLMEEKEEEMEQQDATVSVSAASLVFGGEDGDDDNASTNSSTTSNNSEMNKTKKNTKKIDGSMVKNVFRNFMKSLCTKDRPLLLFLDDMQWIDNGSMDLLSTLLSDLTIHNLFFIGSYRSNEVTETHPLSILVKGLEQKRQVETLELHDLSLDHTVEFVADTLGLEREEVQPLAKAVQKKTLGNIFFTMQALEELVRRNGLYYDVMWFRWEWNLSKIQTENQLSADVVAMVVSKIQNLPCFVRRILMVTSYTKSSVDLGTLKEIMTAIIQEQHDDRVGNCEEGGDVSKSFDLSEGLVDSLQRGVQEGLLMVSMDPKKAPLWDTIEYTFVHDRIQEAAQALLENEDERNHLRLTIAKTLERLSRSPNRGEDWMLFTAAHHMNSLPLQLVHQESPRPGYLARVNLRAAKLAIGRSAFRQAVELLRYGVRCLEEGMHDDDRWNYDYKLCLEMYNHVLETEYAVGNKEEAQTAVDQVLKHALHQQDKLCAQFHHIEILTSGKDRNYKDAIVKGIKFLADHDVELPLNPGDSRVVKERMKWRMVQGRRSLLDMLNIPRMDDYNENVMRLVSQLSHSCLMAGQMQLCMIVNLRAMKLSWELGLNIHLPPMLAIYSSVLRRQGKLSEACTVAEAAEQMLRKVGEGPDWVRGMVVTRGGSISMRVPFSDCIDVCNAMHRVGVSSGDCQWGLSGAIQYCIMYIAAGAPINAMFEARMILCEEQCISYGLSCSMIVSFRVFRQTLLNLHEKSHSKPTMLSGRALNEESALGEFEGDTRKQTFRDISIMRMMLACIYSDEGAMAEMIERFSTIPEYDLVVPRQHLKDAFLGLAALFLARRRKDKRSLSKKYLKLGRDKLQAFQKLAQIGSKNAAPIVLCLRAEEKPSQANYDKAIDACSEAGMLHLEAMMKEWCGLYTLDMGDQYQGVAEDYLSKSLWTYHDWSATGKVNQMRQKHPFLQQSLKKRTSSASFATHWSTRDFTLLANPKISQRRVNADSA